jgi:archaemetzincin
MSHRNRRNVIEFHPRFKPPTSESILKILRPTESAHKTKKSSRRLSTEKHVKIFESLLGHFAKLPKPTDELDWLAQFNERPQSCDQFLTNTPVSTSEIGHTRFIYYIQIGEFESNSIEFQDLIDYSRCFFNKNSVRFMPIKVDIHIDKSTSRMFKLTAVCGDLSASLKFRHDSKSGHVQILAQSMHTFLNRLKKPDTYCLIGFTGFDLYTDETDLFIAGLCEPYKRVGVFSFFRYNPRLKFSEETWHDVKSQKLSLTSDKSVLLARSCKLLVHETCHLLGFEHCVYMDCCMNGSGHLAEDFRQSMFLCPIDLKKLAHIIEFDMKERYERMRTFFEKHLLESETKWLNNVIASI